MQHPIPSKPQELRAESMDSGKEGGLPALHSDIADRGCWDSLVKQ
jgi:hypothetical protein